MKLAHKFKIIPKRGGLVDFRPNRIQKILHAITRKFPKVYMLKGRQFGGTTEIVLDNFDYISTNVGVNALTIADKLPNAQKIFKKVSTAFNNMPESFKIEFDPSLDNVRELFSRSNQSGIAVDSSARSQTVQRLHLSEFAFYTRKMYEETVTGTMEALPTDGRVVIETTANGMNHAYITWKEDSNIYNFDSQSRIWRFENYDPTKPYVGVFFPWFWHDEYRVEVPETFRKDLRAVYDDLANQYDLYPRAYEQFNLSDDQLFWYVQKIRQNKNLVKREYPLYPDEAFMSSGSVVFNMSAVDRITPPPILRKFEEVIIYEDAVSGGDYIIGIDPSEGVGGDFSSLSIIKVDDPNNIKVVAEFRSTTIQQHQLGKLAVRLAKMYNGAFVVPERNIGLLLIQTMLDEGYTNIYKQVQFDETEQKETSKVGWRTSGANRELIIDNFIETFENENIKLGAYAKEEMKTFVRKENGKREHEEGFHDDSLFSLFLALIGIRYRVDRSFSFTRL